MRATIFGIYGCVSVCVVLCICLRSVVVIDIAECMLYTVVHTMDVEYGCTKWSENDNDRLSLFSIKYIRQLLKISLHQMHTAHVPHFHLRTHLFASMPCTTHTHTHTRARSNRQKPFTQWNYDIFDSNMLTRVDGQRENDARKNRRASEQ